MTYLNLARYLDEYRGKFPVFSDDIQGALSHLLSVSYIAMVACVVHIAGIPEVYVVAARVRLA